MPILALLLAATPITNPGPAQLTFTQDAAQAARRSIAAKLADVVSAKDAPYLAKGDGSTDDSGAIQAAVTATTGAVLLPPGTNCYNIGVTTINLFSFDGLIGGGLGGPQQGPSCIIYTGTGCAILLDSTVGAYVRDLDVRLNSNSATAAAVCIKSTTGIAEFNEISNVSVRDTKASPRTAGQVGILLSDSGNHGVYWNTVRRIRGTGLDTTVKLLGVAAGTQGVNANRLDDILSAAHNFAVTLTGPLVSDNIFTGIFCSRSDVALAGISITCLTVGDNTNLTTFGNHFFEVDADQGAPSVCAVIGTKAGGTVLYANCEAGGPVTDNNTTLNPSFIYDTVQSRLSLQTIIGAASLGGTSNLVLKGGAQVSSVDGYVEVGTPGQSLKAGVRIASSIETIAKPFAPVDCAGAGLNPTVSTVLAGSIFTCATSQTITLPTGQGVSGLVQSLPHVTVGDIFRIKLSENHATNTFTLVAGLGGTIFGISTITNGSRVWDCRVTSITASAETYTCY